MSRDFMPEREAGGESTAAAQAERLLVAFENMSHGIAMFDAAERLIMCNGHYIAMFDLDPAFVRPGVLLFDILEHSIERSVTTITPYDLYAERKVFIDGRTPGHYFETLSDGRVIAIHYRPLADGGWVSIYEDVTERRLAEAALEEQNRRFTAAISNMSQGLLMFDAMNRLTVRNRRFLEMFGLEADEMPLGITRQQILARFRDRNIYKAAPADPALRIDPVMPEEGELRAVERVLWDDRIVLVRHRPMPEGGFVATFDDITASRRAEAHIRHMAHHDLLTGLPNRLQFARGMESRLQTVVATSRQLAILSLDLDRFKVVNDTMGHPAGDQTLKEVAERLTALLRPGVDMVARVGGDEFAILLPDMRREAVARWARSATEALARPYRLVDGSVANIGVTVGIAMAPADGETSEKLLKNADLALYRAKHSGRNTFRFYEAGMDVRARDRNALEADLRQAIERGELLLHFQPLVDTASRRITGFEPLLRWRRACGGTVSPGEFIPLAEESGLIVSIGDWALEQACIEARNWPPELYLSVNVSALQLRQPDFVERVAATLRRCGILPSRLEFEITETALVEYTEAVTQAVGRLKTMGIQVVLDDFGTGYSSLSYLRRIPFDRIKIDQSFVSEIDNPDTAAIVATIVTLARRLGMATTAEGVETEDQLALVRAAGCTSAQGYLFSPAVPAEAIPALLAADRDHGLRRSAARQLT